MLYPRFVGRVHCKTRNLPTHDKAKYDLRLLFMFLPCLRSWGWIFFLSVVCFCCLHMSLIDLPYGNFHVHAVIRPAAQLAAIFFVVCVVLGRWPLAAGMATIVMCVIGIVMSRICIPWYLNLRRYICYTIAAAACCCASILKFADHTRCHAAFVFRNRACALALGRNSGPLFSRGLFGMGNTPSLSWW